MWERFKAVNRRIVDFTNWRSKITLINAIGLATGLVGTITSFSGGFDRLVPPILGYLTGNPSVAAGWSTQPHWLAKLLTSLAILLFLYLTVIATQALLMLEESPGGMAPSDWFADLTKVFGLKYSSVRDFYAVTNLEGDCRVTLNATFDVGTIPLSHVHRKFLSNSATDRETLEHSGHVRPAGPAADAKKEPSKLSGEWIYHFRFHPALIAPATICDVTIKEKLKRGVWMYREDLAFNTVLGGQFESLGYRVETPTELLELEIEFPDDYRVSGDQLCKVRVGQTETVHSVEEDRVKTGNSLQNFLIKDKQHIKLLVQKPILGLTYYLCWLPPEKPKPTA